MRAAEWRRSCRAVLSRDRWFGERRRQCCPRSSPSVEVRFLNLLERVLLLTSTIELMKELRDFEPSFGPLTPHGLQLGRVVQALRGRLAPNLAVFLLSYFVEFHMEKPFTAEAIAAILPGLGCVFDKCDESTMQIIYVFSICYFYKDSYSNVIGV